jgi:PAS domain S-box-containing protein
MKITKNRILVAAILTVIALWLIDATIDLSLFDKNSSIIEEIFVPGAYEVYVRSLSSLIILASGLFMAIAWGKAEGAEAKTKEINIDLKIAQRLTRMGSWKWIITTNQVTWSEELCRINGWDPNVPVPAFAEMERFYTPESWKLLNQLVTKAFTSGEPYEVELENIRADGTKIITLSRGECNYGVDGKLIDIHGTVQDITERKILQDNLEKSERQYRTLVETADDAIVLTDLQGKQLFRNHAFWTSRGYTIGEDITSDGFANVHVDDLPEIKNKMAELLTAGSVTSEYRVKHKDGRWLNQYAKSKVIYNDRNEPIAVLAIIRDITERKQIETRNSRLSLIVESSDDAIISKTIDGIITSWNKGAEKIYGYTEAEVIGRPISLLIPPEREDELPLFLDKIRRGEHINHYETTRVKKGGGEKVVSLMISPIVDENGKIIGASTIARDISERHLMEEERKKSQRMESIGTLAGGIAHDFNNALAAILTNIQLAEGYSKQGKKELVEELLSEAEEASLSARNLTQQLLTFSKGGAPIKQTISLSMLVRESTAFALRGADIKPEFAIAEQLWVVDADKGQLNQVISNLVINARQAMPNGGIIQVTANNVTVETNQIPGLSEGKYVELSIQDHGIGIPKSYFGNIFEPYFSTKGTGSGLGLATAYSIIKNHGGTILFDSELGIGTTFHVYLPAISETLTKEVTEKEVPQSLPVVHGKILIMDDETKLVRAIARVLVDTGFEVATSKDGEEALQKYREANESGKPFDAVILDLTIPGGMGGKETMTKLLEINPKVKAIVSSGYANDPVMADYKSYGFSGVVTKPYDIKTMLNALHKILAE